MTWVLLLVLAACTGDGKTTASGDTSTSEPTGSTDECRRGCGSSSSTDTGA
ncbi:MAG: hypothetical protein ABMA64_22195 [Myxococcota bacterium]